MQGSAPGSLCSGCGTVDRELQLVIETDVQLQLLIFYAFILAWGMLQTLLSWEARRWLWYLHCQHALGSGLQLQLCLAHGTGRVQMAAQVLEDR